MTRTPYSWLEPEMAAPTVPLFGDHAYRTQRDRAAMASAFLAAHGEAQPLIGTPEVPSHRGSNRSEYTPPFLYWWDGGASDAREDVTVSLDGETFTAAEWEALNAHPDIDHVTQHATTAHRDHRLMARPTVRVTVRERCYPPCPADCAYDHDHRDAWARPYVDRAGRMTWKECADHAHRETTATYVRRLIADGADGLERGTVTTHAERETMRYGRTVTVRAHTVPASKRQGRRARWQRMGHWNATELVVDPAAHVDAIGAYVDVERCDTAVTVSHRWHEHHAPECDDMTARTVETRWYVKEQDGTVTALDDPECSPILYPYQPVRGGRYVEPVAVESLAMESAYVPVARSYATALAEWSLSPLVPPSRDRGAAKLRPKRQARITRSGAAKRVTRDPAAAAVAAAILAAAIDAHAANGLSVRTDGGLVVTVWADDATKPRSRAMSVSMNGRTLAQGTYKARRSVANAAAAMLTA